MTATYRVSKTAEHLTRMGTAPYYIEFFVGDDPDWDYARRAKPFYETKEKAHEAGNRYLRKMKKNGFEV